MMSDLHIEFYGSAAMPRAVDGADFVIVAGDTCQGLSRAVETLRDAFPRTEVVTVAGNHEYYGTELPVELEAGRERARQLGVHLLSDDAVTIGKARVVGATLWTDYCLFGPALREAAMRSARDGMMDGAKIHGSVSGRRKRRRAASAVPQFPGGRTCEGPSGAGHRGIPSRHDARSRFAGESAVPSERRICLGAVAACRPSPSGSLGFGTHPSPDAAAAQRDQVGQQSARIPGRVQLVRPRIRHGDRR